METSVGLLVSILICISSDVFASGICHLRITGYCSPCTIVLMALAIKRSDATLRKHRCSPLQATSIELPSHDKASDSAPLDTLKRIVVMFSKRLVGLFKCQNNLNNFTRATTTRNSEIMYILVCVKLPQINLKYPLLRD